MTGEFTVGQIFFTLIAPLIAILIGYIMKTMVDRINKLEQKVEATISEPEVRTILNDKLNPIQDDLKEIKNSIKQLYDILLTTKR